MNNIKEQIDIKRNEYNLNPSFERLSELRSIMLASLDANNAYDGFRNLLTQLYPDNAHYILELLQNAQDTNKDNLQPATVKFILSNERLIFKHNGKKLFDLNDVDSITGLGVSTKIDDKTNIGKFGVGFKSVFAITNTPEIISGNIHFIINDLFVPNPPSKLEYTKNILPDESCFIFEFNNPEKTPEQAFNEIEKELKELGSETLLFLRNINKLEYNILTNDTDEYGYMEKIDIGNNIISIKVNIPHIEEKENYWLRYDEDVQVINEKGDAVSCPISIAFQLEKNEQKERKSDWKIIASDPGKVCIFFPAEKETSNLKFYIHAPFASTVARDSVRDCTENNLLRDKLGELFASKLHDIKDRHLLTIDFLGVLPNKHDNLSAFYEPIRHSIVNSFKNEPLMLTKYNEYAPASKLFRGLTSISDIIDDDDLSILSGFDTPLWVKNPPQINGREDYFIDSLDIKRWDNTELNYYFNSYNQEIIYKIESWIASKSEHWLLKLYDLLEVRKITVNKDLNIVKTINNQFVKANEAYFPINYENLPPDIYFVKRTIFNEGDTEIRMNNAKSFLIRIGVKVYDENERKRLYIKNIANKYSSQNPDVPEEEHFNDIIEFIGYEKSKDVLKDKYYIIDKNGNYCIPKSVCTYVIGELIEKANLESEYKVTCINNMYNKLSEEDRSKLLNLLVETGAMYKLEVVQIEWYNSKDYSIKGIEKIILCLSDKNYRIRFSKLLWDAVNNCTLYGVENIHSRPDARYNFQNTGSKSKIIELLTTNPWIPDKNGQLYLPKDIDTDMLPVGFEINNNSSLLGAMNFGVDIRTKRENEKNDKYKLEEAAILLGINLEKFTYIKEAINKGIDIVSLIEKTYKPNQNNANQEMNDDIFDPSNINRRFPENTKIDLFKIKKHINDLYFNLDITKDVKWKKAIRKIRFQYGKYKNRARTYLLLKYNGFCQMCQEDKVYWDAEQLFKKPNKELDQMYLSLCAICARKYRKLRKNNDAIIDSFKNDILEADPEKINTLSIGDNEIRFINTHLAEVQEILRIERENDAKNT